MPNTPPRANPLASNRTAIASGSSSILLPASSSTQIEPLEAPWPEKCTNAGARSSIARTKSFARTAPRDCCKLVADEKARVRYQDLPLAKQHPSELRKLQNLLSEFEKICQISV